MGQKTILRQIHRKFLEAVNRTPYLIKNYYWTGGTVLSEFYLHHRESEDIDLFTEEKEVRLPQISAFIDYFAKRVGAKHIGHVNFLGLESFTLGGKDFRLKVDFNFYPFPRINKGKRWKNIPIDSFLDIAVNKVHTISMRPRARDFVDLFFIMQKGEYGLGYLISQAKAKFDWHIDPIQLGHKFSSVVKFTDLPIMLVPFDQKEMETFFLTLAKGLESEIFTSVK